MRWKSSVSFNESVNGISIDTTDADKDIKSKEGRKMKQGQPVQPVFVTVQSFYSSKAVSLAKS